MPAPLAFVLASPHAGDGKTTLALALVRFCLYHDFSVAACTCGANPADAALLAKTCDIACPSLDTWLMGQEAVRAIVARQAEQAEALLVEGEGGLLDEHGLSAANTLAVAGLLEAPLVLVVDASCPVPATLAQVKEVAARCAAARVELFGILANRVESQAHRRMLEKGLAQQNLPPLFLALGPLADEKLPLAQCSPVPCDGRDWSREFGLVSSLSRKLVPADAHRLLGFLRYRHARKLRACGTDPLVPGAAKSPAKGQLPALRSVGKGLPNDLQRILAVALDNAFCLYFEENLDLLRRLGWEVVFFSPCADRSLPAADALYIGDGWPEFYAERLAENRQMLADIRLAAAEGVLIWAEGAGLAYLGRELETADGQRFPMCGVLESVIRLDRTLAGARQRFGAGTDTRLEVDPLQPLPLGLNRLCALPRLRGQASALPDFVPDPAWQPLYARTDGQEDRTLGFVAGPAGNVHVSLLRPWFPSLLDGAENVRERDEDAEPARAQAMRQDAPIPCVVMFSGPLRVGRGELIDCVSRWLERRGKAHVRVSLDDLVDSVQNKASRRIHLKQTEALGLVSAHDYHVQLRRTAEQHGLVLCDHVLCGRVDWMLDLRDTLAGIQLVVFELTCDIQVLFAREKDRTYRSGTEDLSMDQAHDQEELPLTEAGILPCTCSLEADDMEFGIMLEDVIKVLEREEVFSKADRCRPRQEHPRKMDAYEAWTRMQERRRPTLRERFGG